MTSRTEEDLERLQGVDRPLHGGPDTRGLERLSFLEDGSGDTADWPPWATGDGSERGYS